jgi:curved DNA-binding protein
LKVRFSPHSEFRCEHGTLVYDLEVAPWEAVLGASLSVPTLDGRVNIRVPAGTRGGHKLRVRGRGLPNGSGGAGDMLVHIKIQVPSETNGRQRALWEELARETSFHPRDN